MATGYPQKSVDCNLPAITGQAAKSYAEQKRQKKRLTRFVILACLCLIPIFAWFQSALFNHEIEIPVNSNILIVVLINANVILVLLVLFLILRNLAELFLESRKNLLGSKLKTKLVISFLSLSLIPTIVLFFVSLQFVSTSMDYWFNTNVERSLQESLELAQSFLRDTRDQVELAGEKVENELVAFQAENEITTATEELEQIFAARIVNGPDNISLTADDIGLELIVSSDDLTGIKLPRPPVAVLQSLKQGSPIQTIIQEIPSGDLIRNVRMVTIGPLNTIEAVLITTTLVKRERLDRMEVISAGIEGYRQLKHLKEPFKFWLIVILLIVTLLIIFGAIWFGFYISKGITEPVAKLAEATKRIAEGDLEFAIEGKSDDEIGLLVEAFNKMTINLRNSNKKLAETLAALHSSSQESEQRRRYTEIILQSVSAGVISLDEEGNITTINRFAENLLNINRNYYLHKNFRDTLAGDQAAIILGFISKLQASGKETIEEHLKINILRKTYSLLINFTRLEDEEKTPLGYVLVFDNLTKIEKMQRMAAWREVARRIAHEIKNPLTPIQLSAQRLRKRYPDILEEEDKIFDQCTATIINQVDELKRLVSEFSQFARMPKIHKSPADIVKLTNETLFLYKEAHKHILFRCLVKNPIPTFSFDAEQIKRCLINLLDNAVAVLHDGGNVDIELFVEEESAFIRVIDDGPGTSPEDKVKLFEPYFSTKKSGTGLGLAIVSTIISDHNGYIRVTDNHPKGSIFSIELPLQGEGNV